MNSRTRILLAAVLAALVSPLIAEAAREARLTIAFVSESGAPVGDASVLVTTPNLGSNKKTLKTDARGHATLVLIDSDWKYVVRGEKAGFTPSQTEIQVPAGAVRTVSLTLHPPAEAAAEAANPDD